MITVDCSDVMPVQHELLVHVSDDVGAVPAVKRHEFVLAPVGDEDIDQCRVASSVRDYLDSIGQGARFGVIPESGTIFIRPHDGRKMAGEARPVHSIRTCCGL